MGKDKDEDVGMKLSTKIALGVVACLLILVVVFTWIGCSFIGLRYVLTSDLDKAIDVARKDMGQGKPLVEKFFAQTIKDQTDPAITMELYRRYAQFLYEQNWIAEGDRQLQNAIVLGTTEDTWKKNENAATELANAYCDRARVTHNRWLDGKIKNSGLQDQLKAVEIAEAAFGADHRETYKHRPFLAVLYADIGESDKADTLMNKCVSSISQNPFSRAENWHVYAMLARMKAVQHKYTEALKAWLELKAIVSGGHQYIGWDELIKGLRHGHPSKKPEKALAKRLFYEENFAELDRLSAEYLKKPHIYWDGFEQIDYFSTAIEGERNNTSENYKMWVDRLERWLEKNPNSDLARTCLAQMHIYRAWAVDDDADDTIYKSLIEKANNVMNADPELPNRFPKAFVPAIRLAAAKHEREPLMKVIDAASKRWPHYFCAQSWAFKFQDYQTLGEEIDRIEYVTKRSDSLGGAEGDKFYARIAWDFFDTTNKQNAGEKRRFEWERTKRGFNAIIKEYPDVMDARIGLLTIANSEGDEEAFLHALDGFKEKPRESAERDLIAKP